jgi:hypothetical protein
MAAAFALSIWGGPALAQEADLQRCLAIADVNQRVACYDALARAQQDSGRGVASEPAALEPAVPEPAVPELAAPVQDPPSARAAPTPAPPSLDPRREFGLSAAEREAARPQPQAQLDDLTVVIASMQSRGMGYWQFTTTEGITWRLTETSRNFRPPREGDEVQIRRGRLGSYYLEAGGQPSMRVVRVD